MTIQDVYKINDASREVISKLYGIPAKSLWNWEHGERKPPHYLITLLTIAEAVRK